MNWLKRGCWLTAWGAWVWCGFALAHVLPKELGPTTFRLPRDSKEDIIAFLHNRRSIFTIDDTPGDRMPKLRLRNERTGAIEREFDSDSVGIPPSFGFFNSFRHGFHGRCEAHPPTPNSTWPIFVLDLSTGEWKKFDDVGSDPRFHPTQPWVLFSRGGTGAGQEAVVINLKTGERLFDTRTCIPKERKAFARPAKAVLIGDDAVAIPFLNERGQSLAAIEVWSISKQAMLRGLDGELARDDMATSSDGVFAWYDARTPYQTEVFDLATGNRLAAIPPKPERIDWSRPQVSIPLAPVLLGADRHVLSSPAGGLFDVATGDPVWRVDDHESFWNIRPPDRIELREHWAIPWPGRKFGFSTFVVRRLDDGSIISRSQYSTLFPSRTNADETLYLQDDKTLRALPLRICWLYLATAQAILATPILLLWATLRWRRKRRQRLESATP